MTAPTTWTMTLVFTDDEDEDKSRADALLGDAPFTRPAWWGRARRGPRHSDVLCVGEAIAAARARSDLSQRRLDEAARPIGMWEGHPVRLHR